MIRLLLVLLASLPLSANAGTLHRCVSAAGAVSYQSAACGTGQRLDRLIAYAPEPDTKPVHAVGSKREARPYHASSVRASGVRARSQPRKTADACTQAKNKRSASLEQLGLRRTFDDVSRLDVAVRRACCR